MEWEDRRKTVFMWDGKSEREREGEWELEKLKVWKLGTMGDVSNI